MKANPYPVGYCYDFIRSHEEAQCQACGHLNTWTTRRKTSCESCGEPLPVPEYERDR